MDDSKKENCLEEILDNTIMRQAWLISWMGTKPWAGVEDWRSIMAVVSGRRSVRFVKDLLWFLDVRAKQSVYGMAYYANRRRAYGYPYQVGPGWRTSGSNFWLYGRLVTNFSVSRNRRFEQVEWIEPDWVVNHPKNAGIVVLEKGRQRSMTRSIDENIGAEPWHRWE